jgi:hypothetical protein
MAGTLSAMMIPTMAMTTSSSVIVKPRALRALPRSR